MVNSIKRRCLSGFTLVEIMIVIIIFGILAAVAVPKISGSYINKTRYAEAMEICSAIARAQERYAYEHGVFALDLRKLDAGIPTTAVFPGGKYCTWDLTSHGAGIIGFGLSFRPTVDPEGEGLNFSTEHHKIGMDMWIVNGVPKIRRYWWREDRATDRLDGTGKIGGGTFYCVCPEPIPGVTCTIGRGWPGLK